MTNKPKFERPFVLEGKTFHIPSGCSDIHVTVNCDKDGNPIEVYSKTSAKGGCTANINLLGRLISIALQEGADINRILKQCTSVKCPTAISKRERTKFEVDGKQMYVNSCGDAIGKAIILAMELKHKKPE